jgi:hypothetical protein
MRYFREMGIVPANKGEEKNDEQKQKIRAKPP